MKPTVQFFLETWGKHFPALEKTDENFGVRTVSVKNQKLVLEGSDRQDSFTVPEEMTLEEVYSNAFRVLQVWQTWEQSLLEGVASNLSIHKLAEQASLLLDNPIVLLDEGLNVLVQTNASKQDEVKPLFDSVTSNHSALLDFYEASKTREGILLFSPEKDQDQSYLFYSIIEDGKFIGAIISIALNGGFSKGQMDILRSVAHHLGLSLGQVSGEEVNKDLRDGLLETLLTSSIVDERRFLEFYENHGWGNGDTLRLLTVVPSERLTGGWNVQVVLSALRLSFPGAAIALLRDRIALVATEQIFDQEFFQQRKLRCGISNAFQGGAILTEYFRQSSYAATGKNAGTVVHYEQVKLDHFMEMLSTGLDLIPYCDPVLVELAESEKESNRVLVECLDSYLVNGRNIAKASRALAMNRNTLIYRIEKMETLLGESLEDLPGDRAMSLLLSCELLKRRTP